MIRSPKKPDWRLFAPGVKNPKAYYGLPEEVRYCNSCVISNQRPNSAVEYQHNKETRKTVISFDELGICDACRFAEKKRKQIDWNRREQELRDLCDKFRKHDGSYDCLIPGSGGKDSFFASHILKTKYGMHPLTVTWAPHIYTDWGWKNFQSWIHAGHDNLLFTPNGRVHRLLTRLALELMFHPFQPFIIGQKTIAPKVAARLGIPLIFYGENEAEYGNPQFTTQTPLQDKKYYIKNNAPNTFISGVSTNELISKYGLTTADLQPYMPADQEELIKCGASVHYLGYYIRWHPQQCYYYAVENSSFIASPERTSGTYSKYNSIDDKMDDLHYFTTRIKFGIGRATADAAQEIRSGDISREEGVSLVRKFDHEFPERFLPEILKYLSLPEGEFLSARKQFESPMMNREYFDRLTDSFRSPHLWQHDGKNWSLRHPLK